MKRLLSSLAIGFGLIGHSGCDDQVKLGNAVVSPPSGWRTISTEKERITFGSTDERQQATVSLMTLGTNPTFEEFKRVCAHRLEAEKADSPNVSLTPDEPFQDAGTFGMFFSGKEPESGRLFSGYVTQKNAEVITIYVESIGVDSERHFQSFQDFVKGLKR
jgi:hypothetical protein